MVHFPLCFLSVFGVASKQKVVTKPQSILDAVPSKAFSLASYKPAGGRVFKPVTNTALRPTSNDVLKHVGNTVQGHKDILAFGGGPTLVSKALAAALDDLDTNMSDTPTLYPSVATPPNLRLLDVTRYPDHLLGPRVYRMVRFLSSSNLLVLQLILLSIDVDQHMGAPNSQLAAGPSPPQPMPSADLEMDSDCNAPLLPSVQPKTIL